MTPVLWSFRRCPYAMRARLAVHAAGQPVELREIVLRNKPEAFLAASASATVPCLEDADGVIDESRDIMVWALQRNDPNRWLDMPEEAQALIDTADGPFKDALDRTKYATRYPDCDASEERAKAAEFILQLNNQLADGWLFDGRCTMADMAILPFVRQFAFTDKAWFDAQDWPAVSDWLERFLVSERFLAIMPKYPAWAEGDAPVFFPE